MFDVYSDLELAVLALTFAGTVVTIFYILPPAITRNLDFSLILVVSLVILFYLRFFDGDWITQTQPRPELNCESQYGSRGGSSSSASGDSF